MSLSLISLSEAFLAVMVPSGNYSNQVSLLLVYDQFQSAPTVSIFDDLVSTMVTFVATYFETVPNNFNHFINCDRVSSEFGIINFIERWWNRLTLTSTGGRGGG
jgi:hypothetical protein